MKILFLGALFSETQEKDVLFKSKVGLQNSVVKFQRNLIKGLQENLEEKIDVISMLPVGAYPRYYKDLVVKTNKNICDKDISITNLGFLNLPLIKQLIVTYKTKKYIKEWISLNKGEELCIVMYDLLLPHLLSLSNIKKDYPSVVTCSIIADLPNEYGYDKGDKFPVKYIRRFIGNLQLKAIKELDVYGILTENMKVPLKISQEDYVVIEGIASSRGLIEHDNKSDKKIILYAGALNKVYGLDILLDAFSCINDDKYELWICGSGNYKSEIIERSKSDKRIKFWGYLNQDEIIKMQAKSTLLINPRQNIGEYTKYSFPSKIIEYLAAGKPVLAYKLDGIPDEYYDYIFYPKDNSKIALKNKIIEVCEMPTEKRRNIGLAGRNFVLKNKNAKLQTQKLLNLIKHKHIQRTLK